MNLAKLSAVKLIWKNRMLYLFIVPFLLLTVVFGFWPIVKSIQMSFMDSYTAISSEPLYVGFSNYATIFQDDYFLKSLWITAKFAAISVPLNLAFALLFAMAITSKWMTRGGLFFKIAIFIPFVTPDAIGAIIWRWMFNKDSGAVNAVLQALGLSQVEWLTNPNVVLYTLVFVELWKHIGFYMIIFITNLQIIDRSMYEASYLEGANAWQRFNYITLPELRPAFILNTIYAFIQFLKTFTVALVITQGGPNYASNFLSFYAYSKFSSLQYGQATAMATVLFVLVILVTIIAFYFVRRGEKA